MMFIGPVRNLLATVASLLLIGALYYVSTVPDYMAVFTKYQVVLWPVMLFVVNAITKLTTWKGDDSLGKYVLKRFKRK